MRSRIRQFVRYALSPNADERHGERTAEILRALGADDELISAGLLHDTAKPADTRLWHRVAAVLLPEALRVRLARGDSVLARYLNHAEQSAVEARLRGSSERVVALIRNHHAKPRTLDQRLLHKADHEALP